MIIEEGKKQREERRKKELPNLKLMIATACYQLQCFSPYTSSLVDTATYLTKSGVDFEYQQVNGDSYVDRAKNTIVARFLESDCTDLLMIDSDMHWHYESVGRILLHPQQVVGGFFPMKNNWQQFCGALKSDENGVIPDLDSAVELEDGSCLFKAHLLPGGFLRLKRDILERYAEHYSDRVYVDPCSDPTNPERIVTEFFACGIIDGSRYGEDALFCHRIREMGEDVWVDPNIHFGHYGVKGWFGRFNDSLLKSKEELEEILNESIKVSKVKL